MGKLNIVIILVIGVMIVVLASIASDPKIRNRNTHYTYENKSIKIIKYDECEYLLYSDSMPVHFALVHKGNCKFCLERNRRQVESEGK